MRPGALALAITAGLAALAPALAAAEDPNAYIASPIVTEGEREFDLRAGAASAWNASRPERALALGWGIGLDEAWFTEIGARLLQAPGSASRLDALEWENRLQLTEPGEWPVVLGLVNEVEKGRNAGSGWSLALGPMLQFELGRIEFNLNGLLGRSFAANGGAAVGNRLQFQAKYRYTEPLEFGLQAYRESDRWQPWGARTGRAWRVGPMASGKLPLDVATSLRYNAALLVGRGVAGEMQRVLRLQLEYEY